ncbi:PA2778 family cysteine peptidase [Caenimonas terrae]|uniref:PA2778 family cysteine peptidase n=1 Tax=Caenimonas terrae TaxID=696074 RepID=A0ABW0NG43_9BURK
MPQTMTLRSAWPAGVPRQTQVAAVPFFPQLENQCGPAAMATVLVHTGVAVTPEPLERQIYLPARQGSLQVEMLAAPRRWGRVGYLLAPRYADVLREVAAGNPVILLQDVGEFFTQWHYSVLTGYDYERGDLYLHSGSEPRLVMPFTAFERSWMKSGYWAMVVTAPDRIPATATEPGWINALVGLERAGNPQASIAGYQAALVRWPDNLPAAIGLANLHHQGGALAEAAQVLRQTLQRHPQSTVAMNNLAQTLSDQGRNAEALREVDEALKLRGPFESEVLATRQLILSRMAGHTSGNRQAQ